MHRRARATADDGDLAAALSQLTAGLAARNGSSHRAWADLVVHGDLLAARHAAAQRPRPARPYRTGHPSHPSPVHGLTAALTVPP